MRGFGAGDVAGKQDDAGRLDAGKQSGEAGRHLGGLEADDEKLADAGTQSLSGGGWHAGQISFFSSASKFSASSGVRRFPIWVRRELFAGLLAEASQTTERPGMHWKCRALSVTTA